ncbi:hypothetical protein NM688_g7404 [Phlebia brevispora]|uniref:Uncharacterized protein n=1 Tax=Phlebia brevispora TaxID=194682 RepID=A0ACC1S5M4_9APHY|nr:hypothetical protein NM688_g7404 [Phlebia brevispora]
MRLLDVGVIKDILKKATGLKTLGLYGDLLGRDREIPIRPITYSGSLKELNIECTEERDVFSTLAKFHGTLETVVFYSASFSTTVFRFPSLTSLTITLYSHFPLSTAADEHFEPRYGSSAARQLAVSANLTYWSPLWRLAFLSADPADFYVLGLQFQVPRVRIFQLSSMIGLQGDPAWWRSTMSLLRPTQLIFVGVLPIFYDLSCIFHEGMEDLKHLHLTVQWQYDLPMYHDFMRRLVAELAPLAELSTGFEALSLYAYVQRDIPPKLSNESLKRLDAAALARLAISMVPSIRTVAFEIDLDDLRRHYWSPDGEGGVVEHPERYSTVMGELKGRYGVTESGYRRRTPGNTLRLESSGWNPDMALVWAEG